MSESYLGVSVIVAAEWLQAFAGHQAAQGKSERTVMAYCQDLRSFASWYRDTNGQAFSPELITSFDLREYRRWAVDGRRMAPSTWNRKRIGLAVFCQWAQETVYLSYDPFQGIDPWQEAELPPRWLEKGDYARFMRQVEQSINGATTDHWRWQAFRDQAIVALMVYAGLRESEVVKLDLRDVGISERKGRVTIWKGKGEKKREIPLNAEARRALAMWQEYREATEGALFVGKTGKRLSTRTVQRRVAEIGRRAGLEVTPHDLRHTFAKRALDGGAPLTVVSKLLGHARLETTARYVQPGWGDYEQAVEGI